MPDFESPLTLEEDIVIYFANIRLGDEPTGTSSEGVAELPLEFALGQNYPNPFNPVTSIRYQVPQHSHVTVEVYNLLGQLVATLVDDERVPGHHEVRFDGSGVCQRSVSVQDAGRELCRNKEAHTSEVMQMIGARTISASEHR
jgi:hypothetical protein